MTKQLSISNSSLILQIEDDAFEGMTKLEYVDLSDNKILNLPAGALARLTGRVDSFCVQILLC